MTASAGPGRVVVLGAGAIGASTGALLFEVGVACVLVVRGEHGRAMAEEGVELRFPDGTRRVRVPVLESVEAARLTAADLVLLATMGQHTEDALAGVAPEVAVASFQNGVAPLEAIARRGHATLAAMVYVPAERRAPGVVALSGVPVVGSVIVGGWPEGLHPWTTWLVERLAAAGFRAEAEADVAPWIRAKLLVNLGGIVAALCDSPAAEVIAEAREEARSVWRARGERFEEIAALMERVGPLETALVDGKPRVGGSTRAALARGDGLETAFLHGSIVDGGRAAGIATPVNAGLIAIAERAARERWPPGSLEPGELQRLLENNC